MADQAIIKNGAYHRKWMSAADFVCIAMYIRPCLAKNPEACWVRGETDGTIC